MQVETLFRSEAVQVGAAGPLLVTAWRGGSSLAALDVLDRHQAGLLARHPRISTLSVITDAPGALFRVDDGVRARSVELGKKYEPHVLGSAIVVASRGLGAAMARTFLSGFFLLSRSEAPMKTFSGVREGLTWLQALPGQSMDLKTELSVVDLERFLA